MDCSFDYCSVLISITLLIYFGKSLKTKFYQNRVFLVLIITNMITGFADIIQYKVPNIPVSALNIISVVYFLTHMSIMPLVYIYMLSLVRDWYTLNIVPKVMIIFPTVASYVLIVSNLVTQYIFRYEADGTYYRERGYIILYAITIYYILSIIVFLIIFRRRLTFPQRFSFLSAVLVTVGSLIIQYFFPVVRLEVFSISFVYLLFFFGVKNPLRQIDLETNLHNEDAFNDVIYHNFLIKKCFGIIEIIIVESGDMRRSKEELNKNILLEIVKYVQTKFRNEYNIYRIEKNILIVEVGNCTKGDLYNLCLDVMKRATEPFVVDNMESLLKVNVGGYMCPEEIDNFTTLTEIIREAKRINPGNSIMSVKNFDIDMLNRRVKIDEILTNTASYDKMELVYNPVYSYADEGVTGAWCELRLADENLGYISDEEIFKQVIKSGRVRGVSDIAFNALCRFMAQDRVKNSNVKFVCIRLISIQEEIFEHYLNKLIENDINLHNVIFMISERMVSQAYEKLNELMIKYGGKGMRFGIMEYGGGFSDIKSIYGLPVDLISIASGIVTDACNSKKAKIAIESVLELANSLKISTMINGVKYDDEYRMVSEIGCDYITGTYLLGKIDGDELLKLSLKKLSVKKGGTQQDE